MSSNETLDIHRVMGILPHRYPFLLIDRVIDYTVGESLRAVKNVTVNEPFFQGHFPGRPVFPGVLIIEAIAQASAILASRGLEEDPGGEHHLPVRRHRQCPFQETGRAGGSADPGSEPDELPVKNLEIPGNRIGE